MGGGGDEADVAVPLAAVDVPGANDQQAGIFALGAGIGLKRDAGEAGDLGQPLLQLLEQGLVAARLPQAGANGCRRLNSGQVIGSISAAAFSFIVHEPSGIMEVVSERSRDSRRFR